MDKRGGRGVAQMTTTLNNSYLVIVSTYEGGGGQNCPKFCPRGLYMPPMMPYENSVSYLLCINFVLAFENLALDFFVFKLHHSIDRFHFLEASDS